MSEENGNTEVTLSDETKAKIDNAPNQRTKVAALIECGEYTKVQISDILEISVPSIGTQMTYLRIAGKFITYNEERVYSFCSEEDYNEWDSSRKVNTKAKAEPKTPEEQYINAVKSLKRHWTQHENLSAKILSLEKAVNSDHTNNEFVEDFEEAEAKLVIIIIAIQRLQRKLTTLRDYTPDDISNDADVSDADVSDADDNVPNNDVSGNSVFEDVEDAENSDDLL